jgi:hypothetical protein
MYNLYIEEKKIKEQKDKEKQLKKEENYRKKFESIIFS